MKKLSPETLRTHKGISFVGISTCFICHDGQGQFVMGKRSNNTRDEQGRWEIGGGGLKWGLAAKDNMIREVQEEYGVRPLAIKLLGYRDVFRKLPDGTSSHWLTIDFAVLVDRRKVKNNEPDMFDEIAWFSLGHLPVPLHSQQPAFFQKYTKELKRILT